MAAPQRRDSHCMVDLTADSELPPTPGVLDYLVHSGAADTSMLLNPSDPLPIGNNGADYNDFDSDAAIFPFDSVTQETSLNATPDAFTETYDRLSFEGHATFAGMDHEGLQHTQVYSGHSYWPATTVPDGTIKNIESTLTPALPRNSVQGYRGLPRRKSRYMMQESDQQINAIFIPPAAGPADPLERWKESPPEGEAASLSAIKNALANSSIYSSGTQDPSTPGFRAGDLSQNHRHPGSRAPSTTSGKSATSGSSQRSNRSELSALSNGSQAASDKTSAGVRKKQTGVGRKKRSSANNPRLFCCTFCCDKFKSKFDWMRHEKSLHLNLESWTCTPFGGSVVLPSTGRVHCAYCNQLDPSLEHLEQHNHALCQQQERTFRRKDHLIQHLHLLHHLDTIPLINDWNRVVTEFPSRCGFCDGRMSNWDERADHLTFHFRKGCTMAEWKGDHDFPPEIARQVTHSVPPYLLDFESRSFVPFSATNGAVNDHLSQMLSRASFLDAAAEPQMPAEPLALELQPVQETQLDSYTEVLTRHLSHYAQQMMSRGIIPTEEMFQLEARRLLFDSEDQWNQTMADNPEWLAKFQKEHNGNGALQPP